MCSRDTPCLGRSSGLRSLQDLVRNGRLFNPLHRDTMEATDTITPIHRISVEQFHQVIEAGVFAEGDRIELIDTEIRPGRNSSLLGGRHQEPHRSRLPRPSPLRWPLSPIAFGDRRRAVGDD